MIFAYFGIDCSSSRSEIADAMKGMPDGAFVVRNSSSREGEYTLVVRYVELASTICFTSSSSGGFFFKQPVVQSINVVILYRIPLVKVPSFGQMVQLHCNSSVTLD